ncbi:MAG: hypothetical protein ACLSE4_05700 [Clostridium sp.]
MANRIVLNETSYHGAGAIAEIANEAKAQSFSESFRMFRSRSDQIRCNQER